MATKGKILYSKFIP